MLRLGKPGKTSRQSALMMRLMKLAGGVGATVMGGLAPVPGDGMSAASLMALPPLEFSGRTCRAGFYGRELKTLLLDKPGLQYPVVFLEPFADASGLFNARWVVVQGDRDDGKRVQATLLRLSEFGTHERRR